MCKNTARCNRHPLAIFVVFWMHTGTTRCLKRPLARLFVSWMHIDTTALSVLVQNRLCIEAQDWPSHFSHGSGCKRCSYSYVICTVNKAYVLRHSQSIRIRKVPEMLSACTTCSVAAASRRPWSLYRASLHVHVGRQEECSHRKEREHD